MIFKYSNWDDFCKKLYKNGLISIPACEIENLKDRWIVLKHDVEINVHKALEIAKIENCYGHRGSYYVQAYLLNNQNNIELLKSIQQMGHEISYHYDVMDSNQGVIKKAEEEFENNLNLFRDNGFNIKTVCQHGNPIVDRVGYNSNRDFFRNQSIQNKYPDISDIMVNFKEKYKTEYKYYSDAGRRFCLIFDPINNDIIDSSDKDLRFNDLNELFNSVISSNNVIISMHPHRWTKTTSEYVLKNELFIMAKCSAKFLIRFPGMKKIIGKYYRLAKHF